jgi:hypothetical protein
MTIEATRKRKEMMLKMVNVFRAGRYRSPEEGIKDPYELVEKVWSGQTESVNEYRCRQLLLPRLTCL